MIPISTFQERASIIAKHIQFETVTRTQETDTYDLRGDENGMDFMHLDMTHAVCETVVTMTGKQTGRKLQYIGVSDTDTHADIIQRLNKALGGKMPDDETGLLDLLAHYFDEVEDTDTESGERTPAPNDLIVITDQDGDVVDVVGTHDEQERRYIHVKAIGDGSTVGTIPHRFEMNQSIESRGQFFDFFNDAVANYEKKMAEKSETTSKTNE